MKFMKNNNFFSKLNLPTSRLFESGIIASLGAPVVFVIFYGVFSIFFGENLEISKAKDLFILSSVVSIFLTMVLTTVIYLLAKLFGQVCINVGFAAFVGLIGFSFFVLLTLGDKTNSSIAVFFIGLAAVNALIFILLAYRWSKKGDLLLQIK
jgi:hypothetical protein